jgi:predicted nucleotidyltransferase
MAANAPPDLAARRAAHARALDEAVRRLVETLADVEGVRRVSLFGSYVRGRRDLFTDLDVLVVWDTELGPIERLGALYRLLHLPVDLDLVCYTPAELEAMHDRPFLRQIASEERIVLEKKSA